MNDITLKQLLGSSPKERLSSLIKKVPDNEGAWLLQQAAAANEMTAVFAATEALKDKRYGLLKSFPLEIRISEAGQEDLRLVLISVLEKEELESIINASDVPAPPAKERTEIETARNIFSMTPERLLLPFLKELEAEAPELYPEIRDYLFFFEDMALLDDFSLRKLLREVDTSDLITALVGAEERVKKAFTRNMSKRAAEYLEEDLLSSRDAEISSIDESRGNIINILRRMEECGEIIICAHDSSIEENKNLIEAGGNSVEEKEQTIMKDFSLIDDINIIMDLDTKARMDGLLALESEIPNLTSTFLKLGVQLIVDGTDLELVRKLLENIIETGDFSKAERLKREIIKEGICGIQEGLPTRLLKSLLCSYIGEEEALSAYVE